ncbi:MAG: OmpH family outer membrane protein [Alphaproteobacteria bacterium]
MVENKNNSIIKQYSKHGIIAAVVIAVAVLAIWGFSAARKNATLDQVLQDVTTESVSAADIKIAVIRMDAIQTEATALKDLRKQKESYEEKLRNELTKEQKALEKEKEEIEKSQDVLSQEALQRRIADYQGRVAKLQRDLSERAQSVEMSYQKALSEIQSKHLDPIIEGTISKKNLSLVVDGRFARMNENAKNLDITEEIINALNKKVSSVKMEKPKGF